jgi:hypothetical protein
MFPCVGAQPTGVTCKSAQTQVDEFVKVIGDNSLNLQRLWFDLEPTSGVCNAWQMTKAENLASAKEFISVIKATGLKWGIYANGNQWTAMFASRDTDVASDLPLWAVQDDQTPGVSTVDTFMGGWTSAIAKQYNLDVETPECGGSLDLDSFSS